MKQATFFQQATLTHRTHSSRFQLAARAALIIRKFYGITKCGCQAVLLELLLKLFSHSRVRIKVVELAGKSVGRKSAECPAMDSNQDPLNFPFVLKIYYCFPLTARPYSSRVIPDALHIGVSLDTESSHLLIAGRTWSPC